MSLTNSIQHAYLIDVISRERLQFQYNPSEIGDSKSTNYADIRVPGISHPRYQFISGGNRQITFKLFFLKGDVKEKVTWLQSLLYPEHSGTAFKSPPHKVIFIFGDLYETTCIVRQVKGLYKSLFDTATLSPQRAEVDIVLDEWTEQSVNYSSIRK